MNTGTFPFSDERNTLQTFRTVLFKNVQGVHNALTASDESWGFNPPPILTDHKPKSIFMFILTIERFQRGIIALIEGNQLDDEQ